jgi:hypothetical protein
MTTSIAVSVLTKRECVDRVRQMALRGIWTGLFLSTVALQAPVSVAGSVTNSLTIATRFLEERMDQYHDVFYVYKDRNAGGNHFVPSGWMGDYSDIAFDEGWTNRPVVGASCIRIEYSGLGSHGEGWAGIYWTSMDGNWGDLGPGYDLRGATVLRFRARGELGGEQAVFKVGGINRQPYRNPAFAHQDSCETIAIGPVTLNADWTEYAIDLTTPENFLVYSDRFSARNNFVPSAWYNGADTMNVDDNCTESPYSGSTCVKVTWNGQPGADGWKWNGLAWEWPEGRIAHPDESLQGFDLSGAESLRFMVRAAEPGLQLKFVFGHPEDSCGEVGIPGGDFQGYIPVPTDWTLMTVPVPPGLSMTNVTIGFGVFFNHTHDPDPPGLTFYLDDIKFDRPIDKDLSSVIGGFCWVTDTNMNPAGCTIYLDDMRYDHARLDEPRFLQSFVTLAGPDEHILNNFASSYDNALAILALTLSDDTNRLQRARLIADAFLLAMEHDRDFTDRRVRNVYRAGDVLDPFTGKALLHGWWDADLERWLEDRESVGSSVGNVAWAGMALLRVHRLTGETNYLEGAKHLGAWIASNTWDNTGPGGFTGGYFGWPAAPPEDNGWHAWKSTEHNLDSWRLFDALYRHTGDVAWSNAAQHALAFVESMWDAEEQFFHVGTLEDGITINTNLLALDPNSWGVAAFGENPEPYLGALLWAERKCLTKDAGFRGFDFNDDRDGIWFEGTAQMALAYAWAGWTGAAESYLKELRRAQREALNTDGKGIVAASRDNLSTGLSWMYHARPHVGATSWYLMAGMGYNPFLDRIVPRISGIRFGPDGPVLTWPSRGGETNTVQWREDLKAGTWQDIPVPTTQWETRWTDFNALSSCRFYRLIME